MDQESKDTLDTILAKDKESYSREELAFVMARRGYLNDEGKKRFAKEIALHEKGELFKDEAEEGLEGMTMKALAKKAKDLGIKGIKDMDKKALIVAIKAEEEDEE